jgi:hypothetical protein
MENAYHIPKKAGLEGGFLGKLALLISISKIFIVLFALGGLFLFSREEHV